MQQGGDKAMAKRKKQSLRRYFTGGLLKGLSIPEKFFKKPIKVPKPIAGSPYEVK